MWRANQKKSNVWIADLRQSSGRPFVSGLLRVQELPGTAAPFDRLARLLHEEAFDAAGIDAPFSVLGQFASDGHSRLMSLVAAIPHPDRPFATGREFVEVVAGVSPPLRAPKPFRATELGWRVNARSVLWCGRATPGAPFASACIALLQAIGGPIWPWANSHRLLVEAFPAAQPRTWRIQFANYANDARARRHAADRLSERVEFGGSLPAVLESPDAHDAVVAAFAGCAARTDQLAREPGPEALLEGWIAVHRQ